MTRWPARDGPTGPGLPQGRWVLLDYVDFVVHVFHPTLRNFYQIERLWADAQVIPLTASVTH